MQAFNNPNSKKIKKQSEHISASNKNRTISLHFQNIFSENHKNKHCSFSSVPLSYDGNMTRN